MYFAEIHHLLNYLQRLEDGGFSDPHMKDVLQRLKLKINILTPVWQPKPQISVLQDAIQEYQPHGTDAIDLSGNGDWRSALTAATLALPDLGKLRFIKPEMEEMYSAVFKSSRSIPSENDKDVASFVNLLHENLKDISISKARIFVPLLSHILALQEELRFLRNFLCFISQICIDRRFSQDLYTFAEAVAVNAAYLLHFLRVEKKMDQAMEYGFKLELLDLVDKLNLFRLPDLGVIYLRALEGASLKLLDLEVIDYECVLLFFYSLVDKLRELSNKIYLQSTAKDPIETLNEELSSVRSYLMECPLHDSNEKLDNFMFKIQELTVHTGCFIYSSVCNKNDQSTFLASDEKLGCLMDKIEHVKSEYHLLIPRSWQSNFPKTNEAGYVDFILKNLEERLPCRSAQIDSLESQINTVYKGLVALRNDFGGTAKLQNENEEFKALFTRYIDIAYQAEYFVDSSLCGVVSSWCSKMGLVKLAEELKHVREELKAIMNDNIEQNIGRSRSLVPSQANPPSIDAVVVSQDDVRNIKDKATHQMVGFKDEAKKIKDQIMGGSEQLTILSICGMAGLGKTTLAKSVYGDPSVTMHFHALAWCSVSQVYNKENLLLEMLHQVKPKTKEDCPRNDESSDQKLYKSLKGKRYLVVMDDIWDIKVWDDLRPSFPNDVNGSRIIFTTRCETVATQANSVPLSLRPFLDDESWKLLQIIIFKEKTCPPKLLQVGKKIAENCKGLPLTVVLTAGLLKDIERKKDSWEQFAKVLVDNRREGHLGILELSYKHLPHYLRPCFLYFGAFPEDAEIPVWKLVCLWIAEGLVQPKEGPNTLELEAKNYLNDLIGRSLVMVGKRNYDGVKSCHIHDLLHDFCIDRAKEERFLLKMRCDSLPTLTDSEVHEQYRLCIHSNTGKIPPVKMGHFQSRVRSLWFSTSDDTADDLLFSIADDTSNDLLFSTSDGSTLTALRGMPLSRLFLPPSSSGFRHRNELHGVRVFLKFRLLKVLDLGSLDIVGEESFDTTAQLVHLRYLSMAYGGRIPAEIENLKNLETFLLTGTRGFYRVELPETIWNMVNLRHVQIKRGATALFFSEFFESRYKLDGLTTLSTLVLHDGIELEKLMRKLPNLKKLKCQISRYWDKAKIGNDCIVLDSLHPLEELKIDSLAQRLCFPWSLKKLTLVSTSLSLDEISSIGKLPNLEVLKLKYVSLREEWCMKEEEFQKLKFLTLDSDSFVTWNASSEHFPCLEELVVDSCNHLKEIPVAFCEIDSLRMIKVNGCKTSVVASAMEIEQEKRDMGHEFNLYITGDRTDFD